MKFTIEFRKDALKDKRMNIFVNKTKNYESIRI
jgi:hypothetical protein